MESFFTALYFTNFTPSYLFNPSPVEIHIYPRESWYILLIILLDKPFSIVNSLLYCALTDIALRQNNKTKQIQDFIYKKSLIRHFVNKYKDTIFLLYTYYRTQYVIPFCTIFILNQVINVQNGIIFFSFKLPAIQHKQISLLFMTSLKNQIQIMYPTNRFNFCSKCFKFCLGISYINSSYTLSFF